ncbi:ectonucleoside triphosphate diphosphohydrolase 2 [Cololabis saira]|uniref:ectonucleoside triphosphate diphosphohydrolase 2 n=1 Tax=Cololabis saira TaxID=129043 RepID=UPI002AD3FE45|nr:ectonucleoside triphosphate diphosphohydrolase 2 [Cololabis saira]
MAHRSAYPAVPLALLLLGVLAILLLTIPTQDIREQPTFMYGIVLDAGSSHTALYIYKWRADKQNGTAVVTQHSECKVKGGGISSYAGQQGGAAKSLQACLDQAVKDVPKERHKRTSVYLGATAGMRLLQNSNPEQCNQILQEVGQKIRSYPFDYKGASILSGKDEGAYGWVTVNYLLENFIKYGFVGHWFKPNRPTVGALDFGGASTQITFATQSSIEDKKDAKIFRLYGQEYSLYTHSFLCFGIDQIVKRLLAHIIKSQAYSESVTQPCYPADYNKSFEMDNIFNSPCTKKDKPQSYSPQASVRLQGSGQYEHCLGNVSELFSFDNCPFSQCSFDEVFQPNITGSFMAFSTFFYIHSVLQQITGIPINNPQQLDDAIKTVCKMSYSQMHLLAPEHLPYLQDYCASSLVMKMLLLKGYGFDDSSFPNIFFTNKAGDTSVGWALGYMLYESNFLPSESVELRKALTLGAWGTLIFLFVLLLTAALIFICFQVRNKGGGGQSTI